VVSGQWSAELSFYAEIQRLKTKNLQYMGGLGQWGRLTPAGRFSNSRILSDAASLSTRKHHQVCSGPAIRIFDPLSLPRQKPIQALFRLAGTMLEILKRPTIFQLKAGMKTGAAGTLRAVAKALKLDVDDLVPWPLE